MTQTTNVGLKAHPVTGSFEPKHNLIVLEGVAQALSMTDVGPNWNGDWTYSETAEGRTGEVAGDFNAGAGAQDLDGEPGVVYSGPAGGAVKVTIRDLDILSGLIAPEADDGLAVVLLRNNDLVAQCDEGFAIEFDTATVEYNMTQAYVDNLQPGDVLRICIVALEGSEDTVNYKVADNGGFMFT